MKHLYEAITWNNKSIPFVMGRLIVEYDMRRAGLSVIKEFNLLPQEQINKLESMGKKKADIEIGKMRKKSDFSNKFKTAMEEARKLFIESNRLEEPDIISIKNDAIFTIGRCEHLKFGNIEFRMKNQYTSFIAIDQLQFFYSPYQMDIKGLGDEAERLHEKYWIDTIRQYISLMENYDKKEVLYFMRRLADDYKSFQLAPDYYREFSVQSKYRTLDGDLYGEYWDNKKEELDITYNYDKLILPMVLLAMKYE